MRAGLWPQILTQPLTLVCDPQRQLALSEPQFPPLSNRRKHKEHLKGLGMWRGHSLLPLGLGLAPQMPCLSIPGCGDLWGQLSVQTDGQLKAEPWALGLAPSWKVAGPASPGPTLSLFSHGRTLRPQKGRRPQPEPCGAHQGLQRQSLDPASPFGDTAT